MAILQVQNVSSIYLKLNMCQLPEAFFLFFNTSLFPFGNFGLLHWGKAAAVAQTVLPITTSACSTFMCPDNGMAAGVWEF